MATTPKTFSSAGTAFSIATGVPATFDAVGFAAQTFKHIGKIKTGGEFLRVYEVIKNNYLSQRGTEKSRGTWDAGTLSLTVDLHGDEGQLACETALDSDAEVTLRIALKNGDTYYMRAIVTSFRINVSGPNDMVTAATAFELNPIFLTGGTEVAALKVPAP